MAYEIRTYSGFQLQIDTPQDLQQLIFSEQVRPEDQLRDDFFDRWIPAREHPHAAPMFRALRERLAQNAKGAFLDSGTAIADARAFADAPPARPDWHVRFTGRTLGPLPEERLVAMISRGEVPPDAQAYASGSSRWLPITEIEQLRGFLPMESLAPAAQAPPPKPTSSVVIRGLNPPKPPQPGPSPKPLGQGGGLLPSLPDDLKQFVMREDAPQAAAPRERTLMRPREDVMRAQYAQAQRQRQVLVIALAVSALVTLLLVVILVVTA
jgi:hypothetical protein